MGMGNNGIINFLGRAPIAIASRTIFSGLTHALVGHIYTPLSVLTGGVLGVTSSLSATAIRFGLDQMMPNYSRIAKLAISQFGGIAAGFLTTYLVGLPITFEAAIILNLTTMGIVLGGLICTTAAITATLAAMTVIRAFWEDITIREAAMNYGREILPFVRSYIIPALEVLGFHRQDVEVLFDRIEQALGLGAAQRAEDLYRRIFPQLLANIVYRESLAANPLVGRTLITRTIIPYGNGRASVFQTQISFSGPPEPVPIDPV
jgi:hypothetical protein